MSKRYSLLERHEWWGTWWTPEEPDNRFGGLAIYEPEKGISLRVAGGFEYLMFEEPRPGVRTFSGASKALPVVFGVVDGVSVSLVDCNVSASRGGLFADRPADQTLTAGMLLHGVHLDDPSDASVVAVELAIEHLPIWTGMTAIGAEMRLPTKETGEMASATYHVGSVPRQYAHVGGDQYILDFAYGIPNLRSTTTRHEAVLYDEPRLRVEYAEPRTVHDVLPETYRLSNLITLSIGAPCAVVSRTLVIAAEEGMYPPDHPLAASEQRVACLTRHRVREGGAVKATAHHELIFTLADVPFDELIPRWLAISDRFLAATNMILGLLDDRNGYLENRTITAVAAAESFHRSLNKEPPVSDAEFRQLRKVLTSAAPPEMRGLVSERFSRNEPSLRSRLLDLHARLDPKLGTLLARDPDVWAKHARDSRNLLAHEGARPSGDYELLYAVTEVTCAVVILNLLQELGVPRDRLIEKMNENRMLMRAMRLARDHLTDKPGLGAQ